MYLSHLKIVSDVEVVFFVLRWSFRGVEEGEEPVRLKETQRTQFYWIDSIKLGYRFYYKCHLRKYGASNLLLSRCFHTKWTPTGGLVVLTKSIDSQQIWILGQL